MSSRDEIQRAYDLASDAYAQKFLDELEHKPLDRELLREFAEHVGPDRAVLDLGCGPGHTTAFLTARGVNATGIDLSRGMVDKASALFPEIPFEQGDLFSLPRDAGSIGGILAFYCIVHLDPKQLEPAFEEMLRVLEPGGVLLLSFHVGSENVHVDDFLDTSAALDFSTFEVQEVQDALNAAGYVDLHTQLRDPYEIEYPSQRCYVRARKPTRP